MSEHASLHIDITGDVDDFARARLASAERAEAIAEETSDAPAAPGGVVLDASQHHADDDADGPRPLDRLLGKSWAIIPEALLEIGTRLNELSYVSKDMLAARRPSTARRPAADGSEVAVIPLRGTITPRGSWISLLFGGGGSLQAFREQFRQAMADGNVSAVVLDIDSPGGLIDLVPEAAADVRGARGGKPIVAISNTVCASAAYWIGAQADEFVITPSGQAGSIGVYTIHEDVSRLEQMMGIKTTVISAGQFKVDGNPYEPLSKSAKQALQQEVDDLYGMFTADVAAGRGVSAAAVKGGYGRGRCVLAEKAVRIGLADRVETFEQLVARLGGTAKDPQPAPDDLLDEEDSPTRAQHERDTTSPETSPARAEEAHDHQVADYLTGPALREQPAWQL